MAYEWDLALVPCTRGKNPTGVNAATLYRGGTYSLIMRHATQRARRVMIMSAKHGLVDLDTPMRYYDAFITTISTQERLELIARVRRQAEPLRGLRTLSYLWIPYHQVIMEADVDFGVSCRRPYKGLPTFPATLQKILTREVASYGTNPARR